MKKTIYIAAAALLLSTLAFSQDSPIFKRKYIKTDKRQQLQGLTEKVAPAGADVLMIEDSEETWIKKRVQISNLPAGGGGETNTHSSDGGGLALTAATPKVGVDLRLVSFAAADFNVAADLFSIDDVNWASQAELEAQDTCSEITNCTPSAITGTGVTYEQLATNSDIGFGAAQVPQGSAVCQSDGTNCDATQAELDAQDECSEITNCTPSAIIGTGVTYEQLSTNSDIGFGAAQVPQGSLAAPLANPALTGDPTAPTPAVTDSDTSIATSDMVDRKPTQECKTIENLVAADDDVLIWVPRANLTVTAVACQSSAAATVVLEDYGGTAIETIVCETDGALAWDVSMSGTATLIAGEVIRMDTTSESTPTWTMVCLEWRND